MRCACCGFEPDGKDPRQLINVIKLTRLERNLFECFANNFGRWLTHSKLVDAGYSDDASGGPENAEHAVAVRLHFFKKKIAPYGLVLDTKMGPGGGRRMIWAAEA